MTSPSPQAGRLAMALQDLLTLVARLRAGRQPVQDGIAFRAHAIGLVTKAQQAAQVAGYTPEETRYALFAAVALLDESVLGAHLPALADWGHRPMQQELFDSNLAGELFFAYLEALEQRSHEPRDADVLEPYLLALLLGFRGRLAGDGVAADAITQRVGDRIQRLRGGVDDAIAPGWLPHDRASAPVDERARFLARTLIAGVVALLVLWGVAAFATARESTSLRDAVAARPR